VASGVAVTGIDDDEGEGEEAEEDGFFAGGIFFLLSLTISSRTSLALRSSSLVLSAGSSFSLDPSCTPRFPSSQVSCAFIELTKESSSPRVYLPPPPDALVSPSVLVWSASNAAADSTAEVMEWKARASLRACSKSSMACGRRRASSIRVVTGRTSLLFPGRNP
jgi:hypothetical protein